MPEINLSTFIEMILTIISGAGGTYLATEVVKRAKNIPFISEGNTAAIRACAAVMAALSTLVLSLVNGTLQAEDLQGFVVKGLTFAAIWYSAHAAHVVIPKPESGDGTDPQ